MKVLEVGSCDVNGSVRPIFESLCPEKYLGVDIEHGKGVDALCSAGEVVDRYGEGVWDVVVSTELLEHVVDWRKVVSNLKRALCCGGILIVTTRSPGFLYHPFPIDCWRFRESDMKSIFRDFNIEHLRTDTDGPGVMMKARKPKEFTETPLSGIVIPSAPKPGDGEKTK